MKVIVGKNAGFCFGVKRAVEGCLNNVNNENIIYSLGEIVHNEKVILDLKNKGVIFVNNINEIPNNSIVVIRAHGIAKDIYKSLDDKNIKYIDYTCPFVLKIHKLVSKYSNDNYYIFLVGDKLHPEIIGTKSYCNHYSIIENVDEINDALEDYYKSGYNRALVVAQTTYSKILFQDIVEIIKSKIRDVTINNTICNVTEMRQEETKKLANNVDLMIIIGGKNSSNTKKLYEIANRITNTIMIQSVDDIKSIELANYYKIGIMAGASTPQEIIEEVVYYLEK